MVDETTAKSRIIMDERFQEFVSAIAAKGQITFGDVRRLQRSLATEIMSRQTLEALIALNGKVERTDKAWAEWLVAAVADFVANAQACEASIESPEGAWLEDLLAGSATKLGRRIARQIRSELARRAITSGSEKPHYRECPWRYNVQHPSQSRAAEKILPTAWSEMMLGPSHRAALQFAERSMRLAA